MAHNIAKNAVERTSAALLDKVFPDLGKVAGGAARELREAAALAANAYFCRWSVMERTRFISGRPRKRKPPDMTAFLPGFSA